MHGGVLAVFVLVVGARFLLPLTIPRWPLPGIVACLVLDAVDQTVFQTFGYDPPEYQGYDKAMDVFYLAVAYLATLRNWASLPAFEIGRFLYFYRLVGVVAFELAQARALLLVFANTFEYFFIAYEAVRLRWDPLRVSARAWLWVAVAIWVGIKLPQEWWIHIAKLDFTDAVGDHTWFAVLVVAGLVGAAALCWFVVRPRTPAPQWPPRLAADPLPEQIDSAAEVAAWTASSGRLLSWVTLEKVVLVGLLCVVFAQVLPGVDADPTAVFLGVGAFVVVNAAITLAAHRRSRSVESLAAAFLVRTAVNVGLVVVEGQLLGRVGGQLPYAHTLFFVLLLSMLTTMHDRWHPVYDWRRAQQPVRT
jgi:hypothetical protein